MLHTEVNAIASSLTDPQRDVLRMLDGRMSDLELNGTYSRVVSTLVGKGLVQCRRTTKTINYGPARGSHNWNTTRVVLNVRLSELGGDFVYCGGLDR